MSDTISRLYELMEKKGIKATPLSKELGIPSSSFPDWKKGKASPSLKALMQFSEYFDVSLDYLVYGKEHSSVLEFSSINKEDKELLEKNPFAYTGTSFESSRIY